MPSHRRCELALSLPGRRERNTKTCIASGHAHAGGRGEGEASGGHHLHDCMCAVSSHRGYSTLQPGHGMRTAADLI